MEQALYQLLSELKQHDVASPLICQGLLLRIFRILEQIMNFRCQNNCENR